MDNSVNKSNKHSLMYHVKLFTMEMTEDKVKTSLQITENPKIMLPIVSRGRPRLRLLPPPIAYKQECVYMCITVYNEAPVYYCK